MSVTYEFDGFTAQISAPTITMSQFIDNLDGTGIVCVKLTQGNSPNTAIVVELEGFTYVGDPTHAAIEVWALAELIQYEV